jgi:hypothetical protein
LNLADAWARVRFPNGSIDHIEFYAKYSGEVDLGPVRANRGREDTCEPTGGNTIDIPVPRPEPISLSIESGDNVGQHPGTAGLALACV